MPSSLTKTQFKTFAIAFFASALAFNILGCSKEPAPYTSEALENILKSSGQIEQKIVPENAPENEKIKLYIDQRKKIYEKAGYDYEKSIIKFIKDFETNPNYFSQTSSLTTSAALIMEETDKLCKIIRRSNIKPDGFLSIETVQAVNSYNSIFDIQSKIVPVINAMGVLKNAICAYKEWRSFTVDAPNEQVIQTEYAILMPSENANYSYDASKRQITATIKNLNSKVDGKTIILSANEGFNEWKFGGTVNSIYKP